MNHMNEAAGYWQSNGHYGAGIASLVVLAIIAATIVYVRGFKQYERISPKYFFGLKFDIMEYGPYKKVGGKKFFGHIIGGKKIVKRVWIRPLTERRALRTNRPPTKRDANTRPVHPTRRTVK